MLRYFLFLSLALASISLAAQKPSTTPAQKPATTAAAQPTGPKVRLVFVAGDTSLMTPLKAALQGHVQLDSTAPVALMASFTDPKLAPVPDQPGVASITLDLQLKAVYLPTGTQASDRTIQMEGKGPNAGLARRVALRRLNSTHVDMFNWGRQFANEYALFFRNNCDTLLAQASQYATAGKHQSAFALMAGVPENVSCSKQAATLTNEYYQAYQKTNTPIHLMQARKALSNGQVALALTDLKMIDPETPYAPELITLLDSIATKMPDQLPAEVARLRQSIQQKVQWAAVRKQIKYALMERHIMAIKEEK